MSQFINWRNRPVKNNTKKNYNTGQYRVISGSELDDLMTGFPVKQLELSYGKKLHKKVYADIFVLIPKGPKTIAWFTNINGSDVCIFLETGRNANHSESFYPASAIIRPVSFNNTLSYGTLLYGTMVGSGAGNHKYFVCEDVIKYKGDDMRHIQFDERLDTIKHIMMHDVSQLSYTQNMVGFTIPCIFTNFEHACNTILNPSLVGYKPYCIQTWKYTHTRTFGHFHENIIKEIIGCKVNQSVVPTNNIPIRLRCEPNPDTYSFTDPYTHTRQFIGISTYETSVAMNNLFRRYKENHRLDSLEESDDECDFENTDICKYSSVGKEADVACSYDISTKKWIVDQGKHMN